MRAGTIKRAMFVAKGSLFLGKMTNLADGMSVLVDASTPGLELKNAGVATRLNGLTPARSPSPISNQPADGETNHVLVR